MATDPYAPLETIETQPFLSNPPPELSMRPEDIKAGGGFSEEQLQQTARQMQYDQDSVTSYMEAQAINQKAMEDLRAIREQREAKLAAERAGIDQLISSTAARVRQRNEEARAKEAELNPPGAALFRMQQKLAREEEARMRNRTRGDEMTYDPETRTWTRGTPPDRSDAAIERAIQLRKDLGYDASGVPVRNLEPSWKEVDRRVRGMVEGIMEIGADVNRAEMAKSLSTTEGVATALAGLPKEGTSYAKSDIRLKLDLFNTDPIRSVNVGGTAEVAGDFGGYTDVTSENFGDIYKSYKDLSARSTGETKAEAEKVIGRLDAFAKEAGGFIIEDIDRMAKATGAEREKLVASQAAAEQQRKASYIDEVAAGTAGVPLTSADRDFIRSTPGGAAMLRDYDNRLERVMQAITTQVGGLVGENGQIDQKKLISAAIDNENFTPSMAGDITNLTKNMADSYNIDAIKRRDIELKLKEQEQQAAGISGGGRGRGGGGIKSASDIIQEAFVAGTLKKTIPEVDQLMTGGMSAGEALKYGEYNIETPAMTSDRRGNISNQLTYDRFGVGALDGTAEGVVIDDAVIAEQSARLGDLYEAALKSQKDPVTYIAEQMSQATKGMTAVEGNQYIQEFVRLSDEYVKNQVETKAQGIIGAQVQEAGRRITNIGVNIVLDAQSAGSSAFAFDSEVWKQAEQVGTRDAQLKAFRGMFKDKLIAEYNTQLANVPPDGAAILRAQYDKYINALGTQFEADMAAQDPAFADLVQQRDIYVKEGNVFLKLDENDYLNKEEKQRAAMTMPGPSGTRPPYANTHTQVRVGNTPYAFPNTVVNDERLKEAIRDFSGNKYFIDMLNGVADENGIISSSAGVTRMLSQIVQPPTEQSMSIYPEKMRDQVAAYYSALPEGSKARAILDVPSLDLVVGSDPDLPFDVKQYGLLQSAIQQANAAESKESQLKAADDVLNKSATYDAGFLDMFQGRFSDVSFASPISEIITKDATLNSMFDDPQTRDKAIAIAYVKQREIFDENRARLVVDSVAPRVERFSVNSPAGGASSMGDLRNQVYQYRRDAIPTRPADELEDNYRELRAWGQSVGIEALRRDLETYDEMTKVRAESYGNASFELPSISKLTVQGEDLNSKESKINNQLSEARNILSLYDSTLQYTLSQAMIRRTRENRQAFGSPEEIITEPRG